MSGCLLLFLQPRPENITSFNAWRADDSNGLPQVTRKFHLSGTGWKIENYHYQYLNFYEVSKLDLVSDGVIEEFLRSGANYILHSNWQLYGTFTSVKHANYQAGSIMPPVVVIVGMTVAESSDTILELNKWYEEEHIPRLTTVPGWRATTRNTLLRTSKDPAQVSVAPFIAVHEWEQENGLGGEAWKRAVFTPWSRKILEIQVSPMQRTVWSSSK